MIENAPGCPVHSRHASCVHRLNRRHDHVWDRCATCDNGDLQCLKCDDHMEAAQAQYLYLLTTVGQPASAAVLAILRLAAFSPRDCGHPKCVGAPSCLRDGMARADEPYFGSVVCGAAVCNWSGPVGDFPLHPHRSF